MAVYFIQCGDDGPVKIGTSSNTAKRLKSMQVSSPYTLSLIREIEGGSAEESWLHKRYADKRQSGEWFAFSVDMLAVVVPPQPIKNRCCSVKLKAYIENNGLTLTDFAASIGRNVATVSRIVRGEQMPSPDTIKEIMKVTRNRVKANDFFESA